MDPYLKVVNEMHQAKKERRTLIGDLLLPNHDFQAGPLHKRSKKSSSSISGNTDSNSIFTSECPSHSHTNLTIESSLKSPADPLSSFSDLLDGDDFDFAFGNGQSAWMTTNQPRAVEQPKLVQAGYEYSQSITAVDDSTAAKVVKEAAQTSKSKLYKGFYSYTTNTSSPPALTHAESMDREQELSQVKSKATSVQKISNESERHLPVNFNLAEYSEVCKCAYCETEFAGSNELKRHRLMLSRVGMLEPRIVKRSDIRGRILSKDSTTAILPSKLNTINIGSSPYFPSSSLVDTALTIIVINRGMKRWLAKKISPINMPRQSEPPQYERELSWPEHRSIEEIEQWSWLSASRTSVDSTENISVNSLEEDDTEHSQNDTDLDRVLLSGETSSAGSQELFNAIRPFLDLLPDFETSRVLAVEISLLLEVWLERYMPFHCAGDTSASSSANFQDGNHNSQASSSHAGGSKRRLADDGNDDTYPYGNDGDDNQKRRKKKSASPEETGKRWACPYYQRDPYRYCVIGQFGDYRSCSKGPGFREVHRVKTHLYNQHAAIYCRRCYRQFTSKNDLITHQRNPTPCNFQIPASLEGLDESQKDLLKPRDRNKSEEDRWRAVYKICFPEDQNIPSPYYVHYTQEIAILRRDIIAIAEEETLSMPNFNRERLLQRLREAFDSNAQRSRFSSSPQAVRTLLTPAGSDTSQQVGLSRIISNPLLQESNASATFLEDNVVDSSVADESNDIAQSLEHPDQFSFSSFDETWDVVMGSSSQYQ